MVINRWGTVEIFLEPFSKCSCLFTSVLFITPKPGTFVFLHHSFCMMISLSLGTTRGFLIILHPLEGTCIHFLLHLFLTLSPSPFVYGATMWVFFFIGSTGWFLLVLLEGLFLGVVFDFELVEWLGGILASL